MGVAVSVGCGVNVDVGIGVDVGVKVGSGVCVGVTGVFVGSGVPGKVKVTGYACATTSESVIRFTV